VINVAISQITSYGTTPVTSVYLIPTQNTNQVASAAPPPPAKTDTVHLSGAALARSLELQGYSPEGIAAKLGTSARVVDQYLGIAATGVRRA